MLTHVAGEEVRITVPFTRDGEPFLADDLSVSWSLRGHDGSMLLTGQAPYDASDTRADILIPGSVTSITAPRRFEKRFLIVSGTDNDVNFSITVPFRVAPWLNTSVTNAAVRSFIGTDEGELPDADIDIISAYYMLIDQLGDAAFEAALESGDRSEIIANNAIMGMAVIQTLPGLRARMSKKESDGNMTVERFPIDFDRIEADALRAIAAATRSIGGFDDTSTTRTLFVVGTPSPDPVTGG